MHEQRPPLAPGGTGRTASANLTGPIARTSSRSIAVARSPAAAPAPAEPAALVSAGQVRALCAAVGDAREGGAGVEGGAAGLLLRAHLARLAAAGAIGGSVGGAGALGDVCRRLAAALPEAADALPRALLPVAAGAAGAAGSAGGAARKGQGRAEEDAMVEG